MQNRRNEDGSYTWYITDEQGRSVPVTILAGTLADELERIDNHTRDGDIRWRHIVDLGFEAEKGKAEKEGLPDPITRIQSKDLSVEDQVVGLEKTEKIEVLAVREAVMTLSKKYKEIYEKRYETNWTQVELAEMEGKGKSTICMREKKMQDLIREQLGRNGIDDAFFDRKLCDSQKN